jgi:hypothetical protein
MHSSIKNDRGFYLKEALLLASVAICQFWMMALLLTDATAIAKFPQETLPVAVVRLPKPYVVGLPERLEPAGTR